MPEPNIKPTVLHIITCLNTGGAEMMVLKLILTLKPSLQSCVIVLRGPGTLSQQLFDMNVPVYYLDMEPGSLPNLAVMRKLISIVREFRPDIIHGWMYHGNLAAAFASIVLYPKPALIWSIRQTLYNFDHEKVLTSLVTISDENL